MPSVDGERISPNTAAPWRRKFRSSMLSAPAAMPPMMQATLAPTGAPALFFVRASFTFSSTTRSDVPFGAARTGDTKQLEAALASGAQIVSTDFPVPGLAARYGSDYVAQLPGGGPARCNPVGAPRSCHTVED
ncbi:Ca2+-dependent phosphoinositide-specific phospholipase C [Streptomyces sp. NPDC056653]|uniref:Ca2+-dependent phosphoinositide-specific phospholipase C n=1 Tax=Streptomyces sp. NPDC056653 TaxID=3345894 RepID=UPI00369193AB